jgi:hypothetical protein
MTRGQSARLAGVCGGDVEGKGGREQSGSGSERWRRCVGGRVCRVDGRGGRRADAAA